MALTSMVMAHKQKVLSFLKCFNYPLLYHCAFLKIVQIDVLRKRCCLLGKQESVTSILATSLST